MSGSLAEEHPLQRTPSGCSVHGDRRKVGGSLIPPTMPTVEFRVVDPARREHALPPRREVRARNLPCTSLGSSIPFQTRPNRRPPFPFFVPSTRRNRLRPGPDLRAS